MQEFEIEFDIKSTEFEVDINISNEFELEFDTNINEFEIEFDSLQEFEIEFDNKITEFQIDISNAIKEVYPPLEDLVVTPTFEQQNFKSDKYGFDNVKVNAVDNNIDTNIQANNIKKGVSILGVEGNVIELDGEIKHITPSKQEQVIYPSENKNAITKALVSAIESDILNVIPNEEEQKFNGLYDTVNVKPIPNDYIIPEGEINITENGSYDVTNKATANINVEGLIPTGNIDITENGVYDVTDKATATVNIVDGNEVYY